MNEPVKFLLVDDVEENLVALEALLRRDGLEILKAKSGPEALELLLVHDVALALLDVQMPEMDGYELAELMRGTDRTSTSRSSSSRPALAILSASSKVTKRAPSTSCSSPSIPAF